MHGTIYVICNIYVLSYTGKMQHIKNVVENRGKRRVEKYNRKWPCGGLSIEGDLKLSVE